MVEMRPHEHITTLPEAELDQSQKAETALSLGLLMFLASLRQSRPSPALFRSPVIENSVTADPTSHLNLLMICFIREIKERLRTVQTDLGISSAPGVHPARPLSEAQARREQGVRMGRLVVRPKAQRDGKS